MERELWTVRFALSFISGPEYDEAGNWRLLLAEIRRFCEEIALEDKEYLGVLWEIKQGYSTHLFMGNLFIIIDSQTAAKIKLMDVAPVNKLREILT